MISTDFENFVSFAIGAQTQMRFHHFNTLSHAEHETTQFFYNSVDSLIDKFAEAGKALGLKLGAGHKYFDIVTTSTEVLIRAFVSECEKAQAKTDEISLRTILDEMIVLANITLFKLELK